MSPSLELSEKGEISVVYMYVFDISPKMFRCCMAGSTSFISGKWNIECSLK